MKNKGTILLLGLIVIIGGWWITKSASSIETSPGVIDVWATWGEDPDALLALLDRFSQESGVPIQVRTRVKSDRLEQALAGDAPPDLAILSTSDPVGSLDQQGLVQPLESWIAAEGIDLGDIYPAALSSCQMSDGSIACLPWGADVYALFWSKALFQAADLDPDRAPATLEELADWAQRLTRRNEQKQLQQIGFLPDLGRSHTDLYLHLFGGSWTAEATDALTGSGPPGSHANRRPVDR